MNRVLKVVFSRAKGMFVVVSELGRACTKGTLKSVLVAVPMVLLSAGAMGDTGVSVGTTREDPSIVIGLDAYVTGKAGIAIGGADYSHYMTSATGKYSVAIGHNADATNTNSVAIGETAQAYAADGLALGNAIVYGGANSSVAIGNDAEVEADKEYSVALGGNSIATESYTISVGGGSYYDDKLEDFVTVYRRIVNVADGTGDHDAVTVGQLNTATNELKYIALSGSSEATVASNDSIAIGSGATAGYKGDYGDYPSISLGQSEAGPIN